MIIQLVQFETSVILSYSQKISCETSPDIVCAGCGVTVTAFTEESIFVTSNIQENPTAVGSVISTGHDVQSTSTILLDDVSVVSMETLT